MSDRTTTLQLSNRCISDDSPFLILPSPDSHLARDHIRPPSEYHHHLNHQSGHHHHHHHHLHHQIPPHPDPLQFHAPPPQNPNTTLLETFDRAFQGPNTQGLGLLPMPVAYEDFQYSFPNLDLPSSIAAGPAIESSGLDPSCHSASSATRYPAYNGDDVGRAYPSSQSIDASWALSSPMRTQLGSAAAAHALVVPSLMHDHAPPEPSSCTPLPMHPPRLHSTPPAPHAYGHPPSLFPPQPALHTAKPPNPPPLFDASEHDLLASFLNIFGDANGECDFEPRGMPQDMPVLGALRRRLEATTEPARWLERRDADDMGNAVEHRLRISGPDWERPADALPGTSEAPVASRKKAKTDAYSAGHAEAAAEPAARPREADAEDVEMAHGPRESACAAADWPGPAADGARKPAVLRQPSLSEFAAAGRQKEREAPGVQQPGEAPEGRPSPVAERVGAEQTGQALVEEATTGESGRDRKPVAKGAKSTHLVSEQRRRNAIQGGFGSLVEILRAGEAASGISIANTSGGADGGVGDGKARARGRGRRGEVETGASKSVVLERAAWFVRWMERGNEALKAEVERIEKRLEGLGCQI